VIAAKAVAFQEALTDSFKEYQHQIIRNAQALSKAMEDQGFRIVSGGTDNHLFMVDLRSKDISGKEASAVLDKVHITVNKNLIPFDPASPMVTSGIRIGTPAVTTRGLKEEQMQAVARLIDAALSARQDEQKLEKIRRDVLQITRDFPIYANM